MVKIVNFSLLVLFASHFFCVADSLRHSSTAAPPLTRLSALSLSSSSIISSSSLTAIVNGVPLTLLGNISLSSGVLQTPPSAPINNLQANFQLLELPCDRVGSLQLSQLNDGTVNLYTACQNLTYDAACGIAKLNVTSFLSSSSSSSSGGSDTFSSSVYVPVPTLGLNQPCSLETLTQQQLLVMTSPLTSSSSQHPLMAFTTNSFFQPLLFSPQDKLNSSYVVSTLPYVERGAGANPTRLVAVAASVQPQQPFPALYDFIDSAALAPGPALVVYTPTSNSSSSLSYNVSSVISVCGTNLCLQYHSPFAIDRNQRVLYTTQMTDTSPPLLRLVRLDLNVSGEAAYYPLANTSGDNAAQIVIDSFDNIFVLAGYRVYKVSFGNASASSASSSTASSLLPYEVASIGFKPTDYLFQPRSMWISDDATMAFVVSPYAVYKFGFNPNLSLNSSGAWWLDGSWTWTSASSSKQSCQGAFDIKVVTPGQNTTNSSLIPISSYQLWIECYNDGNVMLVTFANVFGSLHAEPAAPSSSSSFVGSAGFIALVVVAPCFIVLLVVVLAMRVRCARKDNIQAQGQPLSQ